MWFPMKKGQQNGGILPEKREGYLKAVEFIIRRLMTFPDNQTRKMGGGYERLPQRPLCWRSRTKCGFSGNKGLHARSSAAASYS
ncbi:hypothetical protein A7P97_00900 [Eikenella sp. NML070372]|nr:hypothetical protein A7P97_00900 [Eikenella sp. NML070372]